MAQRIPTLIHAAPILALLLQGAVLNAEETTPPPPPPPEAATAPPAPPEPPQKGHRHGPREGKPPRLSPEALEKMSPEERQRFSKNFERWKKLPADRRNSLRSREKFRRERIEKETRDALEKSGIALSESQRNYFIKNYETERRQLEENLRKEMDEKRQQGIDELSARLLKDAKAQPVEVPAPEATPATAQP